MEYSGTPFQVCLRNAALWKLFDKVGMEMIITKSGRRMFPHMHLEVTNLIPSAYYCIMLEFVQMTNARYRYSASCGWTPAGPEEAQNPQRIYIHPESPARGEDWMNRNIVFNRVKFTNSQSQRTGDVVLNSMHKYQPRILIVQTSDLNAALYMPPQMCVWFPETQFIAVTAYQNQKVTALKIQHNSFAKGFRDTGKSAKSKRKRQEETEEAEEAEETEEIIDVVGTQDTERKVVPAASCSPESSSGISSAAPSAFSPARSPATPSDSGSEHGSMCLAEVLLRLPLWRDPHYAYLYFPPYYTPPHLHEALPACSPQQGLCYPWQGMSGPLVNTYPWSTPRIMPQ